ncbi:cytochrome C oxidase subunit I [Burkholderiales bacterium]|nr:cytochrome C oxidase subunit I [Burkholderiales bacterium]
MLKKNNSWIPWIVLTICLLPVIASTALYNFWEPDGFVNNGELIEPVPLSDLEVPSIDDDIFSFADLKGLWSFVSIDSSECADACVKKLYLMRQIRLTQGAEKDRLERIHFSVGNRLERDLIDEYDGTRFITIPDVRALQAFGDLTEAEDHIYLVDQIGNLMMRFPLTIDPSLMKKDVKKLLKISKAWKKIN